MIKLDNLLRYSLYCNAIYIFLLFILRPNGINFEKLFVSSFLIFSVFGIYTYVILKWNELKNIPKYFKVLFYLLLLWSGIIVVKSFSLSLQDWVTNFGNVYMALAWFTPAVMVVGLKVENWKIIKEFVFFSFLLMLFASILLPFTDDGGKLETEWIWLLRPVNVILLLGFSKFKPKYQFLTLIAFSLYIVVIILSEQRVDFIFIFLIFLFSVINRVRQVKIKKHFFKYSILTFIVVTVIIFTVGYEHLSLAVSRIVEFQDSRTFLYQEVLTDLSSNEKLFGKGSLGTYYSDFFERTRRHYVRIGEIGWAGDSPIRITTEVGYLQMLLKGGYILLITNILITLRAAYLGIFKTKNSFTRKLSFYVLIITILSVISFRPAFTPTFIILWVAIGTILNKKNRAMNDAEINKMIF